MARKQMLISTVEPEEIRIAVVTNGKLDQLYLERVGRFQQAGNIYKGTVTNVEPSLEAVFVDLGGGKNGFLHISDVIPPDGGFSDILKKKSSRRRRGKKVETNGTRASISGMLKENQDVLVQISREGINHKGASLTTYLSLPGRYMVLMPGVNRIGISKKIEDAKVREPLKKILSKMGIPENMGVIIRTAGAERTMKELRGDLDNLLRLWEQIKNIARTSEAPACVYRESDLMIRVVRDIFTKDVERIYVDSEDAYNRLKEFVKTVMPTYHRRVKLYSEKADIFSFFKIEEEIDKVFRKKVQLPSGGTIVIEQTEALVSVDVNSAKARQQKNIEATAKQTNIEAAAEIARQLRLRDIGGLVVIDFIDMSRKRDRDAVERELKKALAEDKAKTNILEISQLGLLEMTRQRVRKGVGREVFMDCPACNGRGFIKSTSSLWLDILRKLRLQLVKPQPQLIRILMDPDAVVSVGNKYRHKLAQMEMDYKKQIILEADSSIQTGDFRIR